MSIYTDSGVTLFQGGKARSVTFAPTNSYTAATAGNAVYVDGVPITGASATMPVAAGNIAGLATLRDTLAVTYQAQLDGIAGGLINAFAESDQAGPGPNLPGLFTTPGATSLPSSTTNSDYTYNQTGDASYTTRLSQLLTNLSATQSFSAAGGITTSAKLSDYASASVSWLENHRSNVSSQSTYLSTLLNATTTALSNATGVNLDDEMSKMLDLERSYSATAKLIATIDTMFGTLLSYYGNIPA